MTAETDLPDDPRIVEVVADYQRELDSGARPDRLAYLERYPELAVAIGHCLDGLELVHGGLGERRPRPREAAVRPFPGGVAASPLGDFQIIRELARGGMGVVYEATQLSLGRRVALKVLPFAATFDARRLQRFKIEAQAAALLHHTHIVPIYAVGCERGVHFYAMQLIEGQSLDTVIEQLRSKEGRETHVSGPSNVHYVPRDVPGESRESTVAASAALTAGASLTSEAFIRRAARLMVQAADALEHAHQEGVIHRDIKPGNLLVDAAGNLWITDFGLAQLQLDHSLTRSGDLLGTIRYMSPEQTSGQRAALDQRTDVYSLGATFYELLTLEPVFDGETHQELLYQVLHTEPRSLRLGNRAVPAELETVVLKALAKNPAERYATAAALAADIQRYLDHQPILARRPTLVDRARKWSRRHPSVVIAGVLLLAVVAGGSLVSNRLIALEQQRTDEALAREKTRAREAEERFQQARRAVDALFQISEEELADRPAEGARRRILEVVLSYYQEFIDQRHGDPASQAELARVQEEVKRILYELNVVQRDLHVRLLFSDVVRQDLRLTAEQLTRLEPLLKTRGPGAPPPWDDRNEAEDVRRSRMVAAAEEHERALADVLTAEQLGRFRQISVQSQGLFAFKEPEIVRTLELTSEQRAEIRRIEREMFGGRVRFGGPPPGGPERPDRMIRDREEWVARAEVVLTADQLRRWRELTGEPLPGIPEARFPGPLFGPPRHRE